MQAETPVPVKHRIDSIDILRGLVMIIMAIDHTRDYFQLGHPDATNLASTTPFLFFTRFITHFCAPTFVLLSGISAYLAGTRRTKRQISAFLIKRGLWLLVVEFGIIGLEASSDIGFHLFVFQVIWAIGASMILLGLLVWLPLPVIGVVGLIIFFGHNLPDVVNVGPVSKTIGWQLLISTNGFGNIHALGGGRQAILGYALLPWTGVMLLGYVLGSLYVKTVNAPKRRNMLLYTGICLLLLFIALRSANLYGDPAPWSVQKTLSLTVISFLNVTKYPCSLLYLCITLGTAITGLSLIENVRNRFSRILIIYGNVPLFYYICHWYLIKLIYTVLFVASGRKFADTVGFDPPLDFGYSLCGVYLIWLCIVLALYLPCKWYGRYKKEHTQWWLSYL